MVNKIIGDICKKENAGVWIFVLSIGVIVAILNMLHVIVAYIKSPPGTQYLWVGHFYLDYFVYLQAIAQGARGQWLVTNPFTPDDHAATILVYWPYIILGKLATIFNSSPELIYWAAIFILSIFLACMMFVVIKKILKEENIYL